MKKLIWLSPSSSYKLQDTGSDRQNLNKLQNTKDVIIALSQMYSRCQQHIDFDEPFPIPAYNFNALSFEEATNSRVQAVIAHAETNNLPVVVMWSGGIDSTLILSAVIKHFPKALLARVVVSMSNASYIENPFFFNAFIKDKLQYSSIHEYDYTNAIILHGDPADPIWIQGNILHIHAVHPDAYKLSLKDNKELLIKWLLMSTSYTEDYLVWLYEYVLNDYTPENITLETFEDFYWWLNFNYNFSGQVLQHVGSATSPNLALFLKNFYPWYASDEYQLWSIHNRNKDVKYAGTASSYKLAAKDYIFSLDKNQHYRDYKTKSNSRYEGASTVDSIYNDGTIILKA